MFPLGVKERWVGGLKRSFENRGKAARSPPQEGELNHGTFEHQPRVETGRAVKSMAARVSGHIERPANNSRYETSGLDE